MKTFREAARNHDFTVSANLELTQKTNRESIVAQAKILGPVVDAIQVTDSPNGAIHMSALAASALLIQQGIDPITFMTCRDRNRIALRNDLLGAKALGITSLVLQRGHKLHDDYKPKTRQVYDFDNKALINAAVEFDREGSDDGFYIGAVITAFNPKAGWQAKSLTTKADTGAHFLQTQVCFDMDLLRRYMACLVALRLTHRVRIIVSLATLPSVEKAKWVRDSVHGSVMPDAVIRRLEQASDPEREGIRLCAEFIREIQEIPGIDGVNLVTAGDVATIPAAIRDAGLRD